MGPYSCQAEVPVSCQLSVGYRIDLNMVYVEEFLRFCGGCLGFSVFIFLCFYIRLMYIYYDLSKCSVDDERGIY